MDQNELKAMTAKRSVDFVEDNMTVGLGTGSTAKLMVEFLAQRVKKEHLTLTCAATSVRTTEQAKSLGLNVKDLNDVDHIDLTIDGADEVDKNLQGIKGGGAAHTFEKAVATASSKNIWIVDQSKLVDQLGKFPLPLEVINFGSHQTFQRLQAEGLNPEFRTDATGKRVVTDLGNSIIDLHLHAIKHPHLLAAWLDHQVGIIEHGLFLDIANTVIVAKSDGVEVLQAKR